MRNNDKTKTVNHPEDNPERQSMFSFVTQYFTRRKVIEAALIAHRLSGKRLSVNAVLKSVKPWEVPNGLHGKFQIKVAGYEVGSPLVTEC